MNFSETPQVSDFIKAILALEERFVQRIDPQEKEGLITDGCTDEDAYYHSHIRILWILKEPYDDDGGGWNMMKDFIAERGVRGEFGCTWNTWHAIIYSSYSIFYDKPWEEIDYIRDDTSVCSVLKNIAVINVKKLPGGKRTPSNKPLFNAYESYGDLLREQISLLAPNIVIGGNTLHILRNEYALSEDARQGDSNCPYYIDNLNRLWIDAYHPGQTNFKKSLYVDLIRQAYLKWKY